VCVCVCVSERENNVLAKETTVIEVLPSGTMGTHLWFQTHRFQLPVTRIVTVIIILLLLRSSKYYIYADLALLIPVI
jgi:hypothetical protein